MLSSPEKWFWDFWFAYNEYDYHIFYLQAPKSLGSEEQRHHNATIGHAVSKNLKDWTILPDALLPGLEGDWDDLATWTGSIIQSDKRWYMFYTGVNRAEKGLIQRIGLATSMDLIKWEKYFNNPVIELDERWYESLNLDLWHDQAWRDPWVFWHDGIYHAFITARVNYGQPDGRGVIAHAVSKNQLQWQVLGPVTNPGEFGQLEIPQLVNIKDIYYLLFSTSAEHHSANRIKHIKDKVVTGTHFLVSDNPLGPFSMSTDRFLLGDEVGLLYGGKLIQTHDGAWRMMAFCNYTENGNFSGTITDPFSIYFG